jgi:D-alanine-D-alanine ligase
MSVHVDPDWWKTLFDEIYLITDARTVCNDVVTQREISIFSELIPMHTQDRILDLCGGHGRHSLELCRRGFSNCTVLDYSQTLLNIGAAKAEDLAHPIAFVQGDARQTEFTSASFDHVLLLGNSLGYIIDDSADFFIMQECLRLLKPGGWLLLDVTDGRAVREKIAPLAWHEIEADIVVCRQRELNNDRILAREMVLSKEKGLIRDKTYGIRLYEPQQLVALMTRAGFAKQKVHTDFLSRSSEEDLGCMNHRLVITAQKPAA